MLTILCIILFRIPAVFISTKTQNSSDQELKRPGWKRCEIKLGSQRLPAVDDIKIFDNDDKAAKHSECFVALSSLSKILISSTAGGLGHSVQFHIFFILTFFSSWPLLLYTRGVLVEIIASHSNVCSLFWGSQFYSNSIILQNMRLLIKW